MAFDQNGSEDRSSHKFHFGVTMEFGDRELSPDLSCSDECSVEFVAKTYNAIFLMEGAQAHHCLQILYKPLQRTYPPHCRQSNSSPLVGVQISL